jgi:nucleotide-binding universal stress UspA family protein
MTETSGPAGSKLQIVGVDGSPGSATALEWALNRSTRLGPVKPVSAWHYPWWALVPTATGTMIPPGDTEFQAVAEKVMRNMLERVDTTNVVGPEITHGPAGQVLVSAAGSGSLLVVGTRGRGAVAGSVLGSVSLHCVHHSPVPVVVVPADVPVDDRHRRVVVGIDGSDNGQRALEWAIDNTPPSTRIDVVNAWDPGTALEAEVAVLATEHAEKGSRDIVAQTLAAVGSRVEQSGHRISGHSRRGDARRLLRAEGEQADLLVVGAQGHQGVAHLLLGSVATALVHHPNVATVIVR